MTELFTGGPAPSMHPVTISWTEKLDDESMTIIAGETIGYVAYCVDQDELHKRMMDKAKSLGLERYGYFDSRPFEES